MSTRDPPHLEAPVSVILKKASKRPFGRPSLVAQHACVSLVQAVAPICDPYAVSIDGRRRFRASRPDHVMHARLASVRQCRGSSFARCGRATGRLAPRLGTIIYPLVSLAANQPITTTLATLKMAPIVKAGP